MIEKTFSFIQQLRNYLEPCHVIIINGDDYSFGFGKDKETHASDFQRFMIQNYSRFGGGDASNPMEVFLDPSQSFLLVTSPSSGEWKSRKILDQFKLDIASLAVNMNKRYLNRPEPAYLVNYMAKRLDAARLL